VTAEGLCHFPSCGWGSPWSAEGGNREGVPSPSHSWARSDQTVSSETTEETSVRAFSFAHQCKLAPEYNLVRMVHSFLGKPLANSVHPGKSIRLNSVFPLAPKKDRLDGATSRRSEKGEKELKSQEGRAFIIIVTLPSLLVSTIIANFLPLERVDCLFLSS
jgi:hypothetical protein